MKTEIIPVIHMINFNQVETNVKICLECGIEKVFLINHAVSVEDLLSCAVNIKNKYPTLWVGVNMLGIPVQDAVHSVPRILDGLWCDETITSSEAARLRTFKGKFFGGLAFKYQPQPVDLLLACEDSKQATDVSCTRHISC